MRMTISSSRRPALSSDVFDLRQQRRAGIARSRPGPARTSAAPRTPCCCGADPTMSRAIRYGRRVSARSSTFDVALTLAKMRFWFAVITKSQMSRSAISRIAERNSMLRRVLDAAVLDEKRQVPFLLVLALAPADEVAGAFELIRTRLRLTDNRGAFRPRCGNCRARDLRSCT